MSREARIRAARARDKAREIIAEIMADAAFPMLLLIAGSRDKLRWQVVPGAMRGRDMAEALMVATDAVQRLAEHERKVGHVGEPVRLDVTQRESGPEPGLGRKRKPETTLAADGSLQAPPGETFIHCAECGCSRWYATDHPDGHGAARLVCVGCGNEIAMLRMQHRAGTA
jgi:hypothetical protein